jgi:hypothetical protein
MTVSLLMGWVLLALLVLLLIFLMVVTMISGRSGSPAAVVSSPGQEVPVNVFQRCAMAPVPVLSVAGPRSAAPQLAMAGLSRWQPGLGAAPDPMGAPDPRVVGQPGKTRSPVVVWLLLPVVTLGLYSLVWYYNINRELHDFHPSIRVNPVLALLALFLPVVNLVSMYKTGRRIAQAQQLAGLESSCSGGLGVVAWFVFGLNALYYQSQLNRMWAR